jgi:hypothetical protein
MESNGKIDRSYDSRIEERDGQRVRATTYTYYLKGEELFTQTLIMPDESWPWEE